MPRKNGKPQARKARRRLKAKVAAQTRGAEKCPPYRENPRNGDHLKISALAAIYLFGNKL